MADGRPHLVTVIGSAGVGKSRLTWELEKYLDGLPDVYYWRKGRCLAYAQASYSALADAIKADAKILDDDAPATAAAKLVARVAELGGADDPDAAPGSRGAAGARAAHRLARGPALRRLAPVSRAARRGRVPWSSSRRTSTGRTSACSTSSSTWPAGRRGRSSSCASPGTSFWSYARPGAAGCRMSRPSSSSRSMPPRAPSSSMPSSRVAFRPPCGTAS